MCQINETDRYWSIVLYVCGHFHLLFQLPTYGLLSVCLTGKRVQRLPVWMLLLPIILASDLKGAEEESGILRLLVLFLSQIHRSRLPAGGALGLEGARWPPQSRFNFWSADISAWSQCVQQRRKYTLTQDELNVSWWIMSFHQLNDFLFQYSGIFLVSFLQLLNQLCINLIQ